MTLCDTLVTTGMLCKLLIIKVCDACDVCDTLFGASGLLCERGEGRTKNTRIFLDTKRARPKIGVTSVHKRHNIV